MRILNLLLVAALWIGSALAWPGLPEQVPQHIAADGVVTWRATTVWSWFLLPALATLVLGLLHVVKRATVRRPGLLNIPGREQLLALPAERQVPVIAKAHDMVEGTISIMLIIFGVVQTGLWHTAHGGSSEAVLMVVLPLAVLSTPLVLGIWLPRIHDELDKQVRAHRATGGTMLLLALLAGACGGAGSDGGEAAPVSTPAETGWTIGVAGRPGDVDAGTTHADLVGRFAAAVRDTMVHVGEGQFEPGTVVAGTDAAVRLAVIWRDSARTTPRRVQLRGDSSRWTVGPGITLGTGLAELEQMNGRPFPLTGFGWDYGGTIMGWEQGALESSLLAGDGRVILRLSPGAAGPLPAEVTGDGVIRSDLPALDAVSPVVSEIIVEYDAPAP